MTAALFAFEQVYQQLESFGSEAVRKVYAKYCALEKQLSVKLGDFRGLAKPETEGVTADGRG